MLKNRLFVYVLITSVIMVIGCNSNNTQQVSSEKTESSPKLIENERSTEETIQELLNNEQYEDAIVLLDKIDSTNDIKGYKIIAEVGINLNEDNGSLEKAEQLVRELQGQVYLYNEYIREKTAEMASSIYNTKQDRSLIEYEEILKQVEEIIDNEEYDKYADAINMISGSEGYEVIRAKVSTGKKQFCEPDQLIHYLYMQVDDSIDKVDFWNHISPDYKGVSWEQINKDGIEFFGSEEKWRKSYSEYAEFVNDIFQESEPVEQIKSRPTIGMTAEEVRNSTWGEPEDINKTTYEFGVHEQWCYSGYRYIYLEDGVVTAIQE